MSGLIQILLKPIAKISIFIKVHIPSKMVCIQLQAQSTLNNTYKCAHINGFIYPLILVRSFSNFQQI